jgi:hypothetical protein
MRSTPEFTADASLYGSRGRYAAEGSGQVETVVVPAQPYSLGAFGGGPRFVWSGEGCPPGERLVCVGGEVRLKYCGDHPCGYETAPVHCECQPAFRVVS